MSDPTDLLEEIAAAEDAFSHASGRPTFEPDLNSGPDADASKAITVDVWIEDRRDEDDS